MTPNPLLGILLHAIGGFAAGSFYSPLDPRDRQHEQPLSLPDRRAQFVEAWNAHGPAHHCAVGVGHIAAKIHKLGGLLGMDVNQVC